MPFTETCRCRNTNTGNWSISELCRRYGVCRDTFYQWRKRRESGEEDWFMERIRCDNGGAIRLQWSSRPDAAVGVVAQTRR